MVGSIGSRQEEGSGEGDVEMESELAGGRLELGPESRSSDGDGGEITRWNEFHLYTRPPGSGEARKRRSPQPPP